MSDSVWPQRRPTYYVLTFPLKFFEFINCIYHIFIVHSGSLEYFVFSLGFNKLHVNIDLAFQVMLMVKNLPASAADIREAGSIPGLGRSLGGRHGNPLQYSCLKNPRDRGAWRVIVQRVTKNQTRPKWLGSHTGKQRFGSDFFNTFFIKNFSKWKKNFLTLIVDL